ncbi:DNA-3-methyladenine glycosylase II [Pedobacter psychrotolerans]|uniref:DNA-3-methyladenine glycosylase II n=1 Tax=Pedobacter psychrotolerans TaxID=1843235 RepID=A0A4R2H8M8_9SPHI|nr:DNA-3-methyladenine glycosylase [Pedobacter psychrotolerans]TCO22608.1 DNA-3-methyladenine glycosylase II [Pedobacter psychrotolerans]GGE65818.1 3-methyladenine DNA glycosylase [Pedobacter psychrotolerans]
MVKVFDLNNYHQLCDLLAEQDPDLAGIMNRYGYPPFWSRPNTFESLVHIILEQQVSLASALAALNKLKAKIGEINPESFLQLNDEELKACYFSRQKTIYVRDLAQKIINGALSLSALALLPANDIRIQLKNIKGIGDWTVDIYLAFTLHHCDIFPIGDLAVVNAVKSLKKLPKDAKKEDLLEISNIWKPYRTLAVMLLWHFYLEERKVKI